MTFTIEIGQLGAIGISGGADAIDEWIAGRDIGRPGRTVGTPRRDRNRLAVRGVRHGNAAAAKGQFERLLPNK